MNKKFNVTPRAVADGLVLSAAIVAGIEAFQWGVLEFEKLVPRAIEKISFLGGSLGSVIGSDEDEED